MNKVFSFKREGKTTVTITDTNLTIARSGFLNQLQFHGIKQQTINLDSITNINYHPAKPKRGYIRLNTINGNAKDKNIIYFYGKNEEQLATELKAQLLSIIHSN